MHDDPRSQEPKEKPDETPGKKFHYNPGNMSGQKAGIVEEIEKSEAEEQRGEEPEKPEKRTDRAS